jgi:hypothetical protein
VAREAGDVNVKFLAIPLMVIVVGVALAFIVVNALKARRGSG